MAKTGHKDEAIARIAERFVNVAQFASFGPDGSARFARIRGFDPANRFSLKDAARELLERSGHVNIRSYTPEQWDKNPFLIGQKLGLNTTDKVVSAARSLMDEGYYVILNEDIDVDDGGFSGVLFGNVAEFAPKATPRCVEEEGCALLSWDLTVKLIQTVYGFRLNVPYTRRDRVEFSVHPYPVGYYGMRYIVWQEEEMSNYPKAAPKPAWPNRYSQFMGDKAYGLLMAHLLGHYVPYTRVFSRNFTAPVTFAVEFGERGDEGERVWIRTCPTEQKPGLYPTSHGHADPFAMMAENDPDNTQIASLIYQDGIKAQFSGAALTDARGRFVLEGVQGYGDDFMVGRDCPVDALPRYLTDSVHRTWEDLAKKLDGARFEWVYSERSGLWVVQLHAGRSVSSGATIFPGKAELFHTYHVEEGIDGLRVLVEQARGEGSGIVLVGNVGLTSHFGDILRRAKVPSRIERVPSQN